ncbi:protein rep [Pseudonocardia sp. EC080625-04]|uniref:protein rep n=1 Tax=Pseudonocardia sp. EC080625-04 TaxID=1096868 RepID=UPI000AA9C3E6|nr:protein rep [Pseudonocardia sp. EC080625-04]
MIRTSETDQGPRAGVAGIQSCGSWSCPVCSRKISAERAREVAAVLKAAEAQDCSVAFVTLTFRHRAGTPLRASWDALTAGWRSVTSGASWSKDQDKFGVIGWLRAVELTHGDHGFHVHCHAMIVFDTRVSPDIMFALGDRLFGRWEKGLARKGFSAIADRGGLDVRPVQLTADSIESLATYISKAAMEAVNASGKAARGSGSRAPFQILRDAVGTGSADDIELFWEIEQASAGRKKITWSTSLREWAGLHRERTEEEIVTEDQHGEDQLVLPRETWERVQHEAEDLLDIIELEGLPGAERWLRSRGLAYRVVDPGRGKADE